ncbi:MAG: outer membrane protein assembly factor BamD [Alphaproteobacteria bacterium]|jgi:outer membrane protein assembly factor BamD|nr:outer membrane protein assembly factor BamD [Alphaproteobacteria bacterium]
MPFRTDPAPIRPVRSRRRARPLTAAVAAAGLLALAACGSGEEEIPYVERPAESIYTEAFNALDDENYSLASDLFDEVERQHPYSQWSTRAQIMSAFSHYQATRYDDAIVALDRFIQLHPGNQDVDYAYYLKALCYYERISDVERDQQMTVLALESLREVVNRFPETDYATDAALKIDLTRDQLAGKDMEIGRWYLRQGHWNAAINRFLSVVRNYETTTHTPEALHRMVEAYLSMGLAREAQRSAAVLGFNYPGSDWYLDSYALLVDEGVRPREDQGFIDDALDWIF